MVNEAVMHHNPFPVEEGDEVTDEVLDKVRIGMDSFLKAVEKLRPTLAPRVPLGRGELRRSWALLTSNERGR